jgi:hypothetical protein
LESVKAAAAQLSPQKTANRVDAIYLRQINIVHRSPSAIKRRSSYLEIEIFRFEASGSRIALQNTLINRIDEATKQKKSVNSFASATGKRNPEFGFEAAVFLTLIYHFPGRKLPVLHSCK